MPLKLCLDCGWQFNDDTSFEYCPHPALTRQMKRNQQRAMAENNGAVSLDQQMIASKQIDATVRMKRIVAMDQNFNAAIQYLTNVPDDRRTSAATAAANDFVRAYFENGIKNVVDLTGELAKEALNLLGQHEMAMAARRG